MTTGEAVWRFADRARFSYGASIDRETVVVASGSASARGGHLYALDLLSGQLRWKQPLPGAVLAQPVTASGKALVACRQAGAVTVLAFDVETGRPAWKAADPGIGSGGACLGVDRRLVVNTPRGAVAGIDTETGKVAWQHILAHLGRPGSR